MEESSDSFAEAGGGVIGTIDDSCRLRILHPHLYDRSLDLVKASSSFRANISRFHEKLQTPALLTPTLQIEGKKDAFKKKKRKAAILADTPWLTAVIQSLSEIYMFLKRYLIGALYHGVGENNLSGVLYGQDIQIYWATMQMTKKALDHINEQAQKVENSKLRAMAMRNLVQAEIESRPKKLEEQGRLVADKQMELERLNVQYESLRVVKREQESMIAQLTRSTQLS